MEVLIMLIIITNFFKNSELYYVKFLFILVTIFLLGVCGYTKDSLPDSQPTDTGLNVRQDSYNAELQRSRELWLNSKIDNYEFQISRLDSGNSGWVPCLIQVRKREVSSKKHITKAGPMDITDDYNDFETVEKMFDKIQDAYNQKYYVKVVYNKEYGYPEKTIINHMRTTDSGFSIDINHFSIVKTEN
jgi:hypothetical protein